MKGVVKRATLVQHQNVKFVCSVLVSNNSLAKRVQYEKIWSSESRSGYPACRSSIVLRVRVAHDDKPEPECDGVAQDEPNGTWSGHYRYARAELYNSAAIRSIVWVHVAAELR